MLIANGLMHVDGFTRTKNVYLRSEASLGHKIHIRSGGTIVHSPPFGVLWLPLQDLEKKMGEIQANATGSGPSGRRKKGLYRIADYAGSVNEGLCGWHISTRDPPGSDTPRSKRRIRPTAAHAHAPRVRSFRAACAW